MIGLLGKGTRTYSAVGSEAYISVADNSTCYCTFLLRATTTKTGQTRGL